MKQNITYKSASQQVSSSKQLESVVKKEGCAVYHEHKGCVRFLHGPDGGSAGAVVAHGKLLHRNLCAPSQLTRKEPAHPVRRVTLVVVGLDHNTGVHGGAVHLVVLGGVVRVHRMGLVNRQNEGPTLSAFETATTSTTKKRKK